MNGTVPQTAPFPWCRAASVKLDVEKRDRDLFLAAGAVATPRSYWRRRDDSHHRKIIRVGSITNYLILKLH